MVLMSQSSPRRQLLTLTWWLHPLPQLLAPPTRPHPLRYEKLIVQFVHGSAVYVCVCVCVCVCAGLEPEVEEVDHISQVCAVHERNSAGTSLRLVGPSHSELTTPPTVTPTTQGSVSRWWHYWTRLLQNTPLLTSFQTKKSDKVSLPTPLSLSLSLSAYPNMCDSGLKRFSNWPTYPQLYVNGELVGGLDILKVYMTHTHTHGGRG